MMAVLLLMRSFGCVAAVLVTSSRRLAVGLFGIFTLQGGLTLMHTLGIAIFAGGITMRGAHWLQQHKLLRRSLATPFVHAAGSPRGPSAQPATVRSTTSQRELGTYSSAATP